MGVKGLQSLSRVFRASSAALRKRRFGSILGMVCKSSRARVSSPRAAGAEGGGWCAGPPGSLGGLAQGAVRVDPGDGLQVFAGPCELAEGRECRSAVVVGDAEL